MSKEKEKIEEVVTEEVVTEEVVTEEVVTEEVVTEEVVTTQRPIGANKLKIEIIKNTEYLVKGDVKIIASYIAMDLVSRKLAKLV